MTKITVLACCLPLATGCSILTRQAAEVTAQAVSTYCRAETPEQRAAYRAAFNRALAEEGNDITIHCGQDE